MHHVYAMTFIYESILSTHFLVKAHGTLEYRKPRSFLQSVDKTGFTRHCQQTRSIEVILLVAANHFWNDHLMYNQLNDNIFLNLIRQKWQSCHVKIPASFCHRCTLGLIVDEQADVNLRKNCVKHPLQILKFFLIIDLDDFGLDFIPFIQISGLLLHRWKVLWAATHD